MHLRTTTESAASVAANWICFGLFDGQADPPGAVAGTPLAGPLGRLIATKDLPGSLGETTPVLGQTGLAAEAVLVFGLGRRPAFGPGAAFAAGVAVGKRLAAQPRDAVAVVVPEAGDPAEVASALTQGIVVGTRSAGLRKTEPNRHPFGELIVVASPEATPGPAAIDAAVARAGILGAAINLARDLVNTPPAEKAPPVLAQRVRQIGEAAGLAVSVWDEARIRHERLGGLLGVASGSAHPPAFVTLEYRRGGGGPTLALVGKGVTFDSGGLSLKPSASMQDMKCDMTGAAVVLATMQAVARLGLPVNLAGYLALAENMTGGAALKLGDVLTIRNGKTVEVLNTDAEGRLLLADALCYAAEQAPARILDLATLTGACIVALGTKIAGLFSNDEAFCTAVLDACRRTGERAWRLPLDDDFREQFKSGVADLKNVGGKWGGAVIAAKFLEEFVGDRPWVHLDIAGPSWADTDSSTGDAGATGCFVRTLIDLVESSVQGRLNPDRASDSRRE